MCSKNQELALEWSIEEDEILIGFAKTHECLYNVQSRDYRKTQLKKSLWQEVGGILNKTDIECSKRWAYVRDYYVRRRGKVGAGSSGEAAKKRSRQLSFLDILPSSKRSTITDIGNTSSIENHTSYLITKTDENVDEHFTEQMQNEDVRRGEIPHLSNVNTATQTSGMDSENTNTSEETPRKQRRFSSKSNNCDEKMKLLKQIAERQQPAQDETDLFFASMAKIVKKLPERDRAEIRLSIATLVSNTEIAYLSRLDH